MSRYQPKITILGAGVVGLSTALCIQESLPRSQLTLIADKFNEDTLSDGAGGLFRPELNIAPTPEVGLAWCRDSYNHYLDLVNSPDSCASGCQLVSGFHISSNSREEVQNTVLESMVPGYRELTSQELTIFPANFKYGTYYTTIVTDCHKYLPWMEQCYKAKGGEIQSQRIETLGELEGTCDIVFNCTGLGARQLCSDLKLVPIRGQTIRVKAPWIKHFFFGNENYIIPGQKLVTLGGIKTYGSHNMNVTEHDREFIWNGCVRLVPSLTKSKIVGEWVGLRPFRQPVRVEAEIRDHFKIVHNYGHGGHGVTLSWGTAKQAVHIANELLKGYPTSHL